MRIWKGLFLASLAVTGNAFAGGSVLHAPGVIPVVQSAAPAKDALITQEATGEAAIVDGDEAGATRKATENAVREAVQQAAGVILESDTVTANSQLVKDQITTHTQGYVHGFKVLSTQKADGVATVKVRVQVGRAQLRGDLDAIRKLVRRMENRKLVIYLDETAQQPDHTTSHPGTFTSVLSSAFQKDGWTLIDPSFLTGSVDLRPGVEVNPSQLRSLGHLGKVDYVIKGNVKYFYEEPSGPLAQLMASADGKQLVFPVHGTYELQVFATDTGLQIASLSETFNDQREGADKGKGMFIPEASLGYEQAAQAAVKRKQDAILEKVRGAVVEHLKQAELDGTQLELTVSGVSYKASKQLVADLKGSDPSVRGTDNERFDDGTLKVFVTYLGSSDELADRLSRVKLGGQGLEITKVSGNAVEAKLSK